MTCNKKDRTKEDFLFSLERRGDVAPQIIEQIRSNIYSRKDTKRVKVNSASPDYRQSNSDPLNQSSNNDFDQPVKSIYKPILLGGESPVTFEGVGFNKKRL